MVHHMHSELQHSIHPSEKHTDLYPIADDSDLKKQKRKNLFFNRFIQPFQSLNFGSQGILLQINNASMIADTYVQMTFAPGTLRQCPAMLAISRIDYQLAGSQLITVQGPDMFLFAMDSCEDGAKRNEIIALSGGAGGVIAANTTYYVPLAFPWSQVRSQTKKIPLDTTLFNGPVKIFIYLNSADNVYSSANPPTSLVGAELVMRMAELSDQSQRLHLGDKNLVYPHAYLQSFVSNPVTPALTSSINTVYLSGFRSGDLCGLLIRSIDTSKLNKDIFQYNTLKNVKLLINGVVLVQYDEDNYKMQNLFENNTPCKITVNNVDYYYIHLNFAHRALKQADFGLSQQFGLNAMSQLLQLDFTSSSTNQQVIQVCYVYQGGVVVGGGNAEVIV
jgi:hypothetical protein